MTDTAGRQMRAADRYAQEVLDHIWENVDELCTADIDGIFYKGSIHLLVKRIRPRAQVGDVVAILKDSGAIVNAGYGLWAIVRKQVFFDDEGNPVELSVPKFGHDTKYDMILRQIQELNRRVLNVEQAVEGFTTVIMNLAPEALVRPIGTEGGEHEDGRGEEAAQVGETEGEDQ